MPSTRRTEIHIQKLTIDMTIKNQPVSANLYYNIRVKGHFAQESEWKELYSPYSDRNREGDYFCYQISPIQSSSQYTLISYPAANYPVNGQVDFQVQALEGTFVQFYPYAMISGYGYQFKGELSDWSNTQTIAIGENSASPSPTSIPTVTPSPSPTVPEFPSWTILLSLSTLVATIGLLVHHKKHKHQN